MNYRDLGKQAARRVADNFLANIETPLIILGGSLGDEFGYVNAESDIDIGVYTTDLEANQKVPAFNLPYDFTKRITNIRGETCCKDLYTNVEGSYALQIDAFPFVEHVIRQCNSEFKMSKDLDVLDGYILTNVETAPLRDDFGIYRSSRQITLEKFNDNVEGLVRRVVEDVPTKVKVMKIEADLKLLKQGDQIDPIYFNRNVSGVLTAMTYLNACVQGVPRSFERLSEIRQNALQEHLGMDMGKIKQSLSQDSNKSYEALRGLVKTTMGSVIDKFPEIEKSDSKLLDWC